MYSYLITYEFPGGGDDDAMVAAIRSFGRWWHYLRATWIITTPSLAPEVYARLRPILPATGRLLIIQVHASDQRKGWLNEEAWDWLGRSLAP